MARVYQALYRKYRPRTFEDVAGQDPVTRTLRRQVETGRTGHAYLFVGTRGTGKTTCAKILARALNCEHPVHGDPCNECAACRGIESGVVLDVAEIDAASNNGVDNIRAIREEALYSPAQVRRRVYIIDEVHMLSVSAFNALLKILEEPPEHLVFILATTELNKVPATILSRCQRFSFRRIPQDIIAARLLSVAAQERLGLTEGAAALLSRLADGSLRDALSLLDQCVSSDVVDEEAVIRSVGLMGAENTAKLWELLRSGDAAGAVALFDKLYFGGAEPGSVVNSLLSLARDMLLVRVAPRGGEALLTGAFDAEALASLSGGADAQTLLDAAQLLQDAADTMKDAADRRTKTELTLLKLQSLLSPASAPASASPPAPAPAHAPAPASPHAPAPASRGDGEPVPDRAAPPPWEDADIPPEPDAPQSAPAEHVPEAPKQDAPKSNAPKLNAPKLNAPESDVPKPDAPKPNAPQSAPAEHVPNAPNPAPTEHVPNAPKPDAPQSDAPSSAAGGGAGDWWDAVLADCAESVGGAEQFLANRDNTVPELTGGSLVLRVRNSFVRMMLDTAAVKTAVSRAASARLGRSVACTVAEGLPDAPSPAAPPGRDKLDDLKQFEGIVNFKK